MTPSLSPYALHVVINRPPFSAAEAEAEATVAIDAVYKGGALPSGTAPLFMSPLKGYVAGAKCRHTTPSNI